MERANHGEITLKTRGGETIKSQIESQANAIRKYTQFVNGIDEQITNINDDRKENI